MNCQEFDDLVELYLVGELEAGAGAQAEAHLADCPACRRRLAAARERLAALEAALGSHRASEQFVERTMWRIRSLARSAAEGPEPLRSRLLRYAMTAAAAVFFILAGYGFLRPRPMAVVERGPLAVVGPQARPVGANSRLVPGDVVATPRNASAVLTLAGGKLKVALGPATVVRVADPRTGAALHVLRGEVYCRGTGAGGAPVVAAPLARVAPGRGVVSLHVRPQPGPGARGFRGVVTLVAHDGPARVAVGQRRRLVALGRGQVVTVRSDSRRGLFGPAPLEGLRQEVERKLREARARRDELMLSRQRLAERMREASENEQAELFRRVAEVEQTLRRFEAMNAQLLRQRSVLERCRAHGGALYRVLFAPAKPRP